MASKESVGIHTRVCQRSEHVATQHYEVCSCSVEVRAGGFGLERKIAHSRSGRGQVCLGLVRGRRRVGGSGLARETAHSCRMENIIQALVLKH